LIVTSSGIEVKENKVRGFATGPYGIGIYILACAGLGSERRATLTDVEVSENEVYGNRLGIYLRGAINLNEPFNGIGTVSDVKLTENNVHDNSAAGITLRNADSEVKQNASESNGTYGIWLREDSDNNVIAQNTALDTVTYDLIQEAGCDDNIWKDNVYGTSSGI